MLHQEDRSYSLYSPFFPTSLTGSSPPLQAYCDRFSWVSA